ncbi:MAG: MerR family transcriptional regulator [Bacteroidota bacterium]
MKTSQSAVFRGDGFDRTAIDYVTTDKGKNASAFLNESRFTVKEAEVTSRVANYWESQGLINVERDGEKGWRKFSIIDLVWLKTVTKLRNFGWSIDKLKEVQTSLFEGPAFIDKNKRRISFFEIYIAMALTLRKPVYLLVFQDGIAEPVYYEQYSATLRFFELKDYTVLHINPILQSIFPNSDLTPLFEQTVEVDDNEFEVLFALRTGNYESITVRSKNGQPKTLELEERVDAPTVFQLLNEHDFQDMTVKRRDGKILNAKRTIIKNF